MKRLLIGTLAILTALALFGVLGCVSTESSKYVAGSYVGEGKGHGGAIKVRVIVTADKIEKIEVQENAETAVLGDTAFDEITKAIIESNSVEIDAVSGAPSPARALSPRLPTPSPRRA